MTIIRIGSLIRVVIITGMVTFLWMETIMGIRGSNRGGDSGGHSTMKVPKSELETLGMMTILGKVAVLWIVTILGIGAVLEMATILKNDGHP